ncbi:MAG TPA: hypothetical protein DCE40_05720 [Exiguobacterium sp.]|nr:hypothetical protein [Exiguobacterium sp.]HAZ38801.1 hypothetical protein [Exiguobacterium sp.]HCV52455.1 hypothetical protein [Exiguobacterium sp.]
MLFDPLFSYRTNEFRSCCHVMEIILLPQIP